MTAIAATVQLFFTGRLISERGASPATITAYRDTIRLLLGHASEVTGTAAAKLDFSQLDATVISGFLQHLETGRGNSTRTRNARLAAIRSLFTYAARRHPEHAGDIARVLAIGPKRAAHAVITYLSDAELTALIGTCNPGTVTGRRDRVMIHLAAQTGLRAAELLTLTPADLHLDHGAHVSCRGKGRKNRITPLTPDTIGLLRGWLPGRPAPGSATLFTASTGTPLSRDAFADRLTLHAAAAANDCPGRTRRSSGRRAGGSRDHPAPRRLDGRQRSGRLSVPHAENMTERTDDGRYILVGGRRWRATDPMIPPERAAELGSALMAWRRKSGPCGHRGRALGPRRGTGGQGSAG